MGTIRSVALHAGIDPTLPTHLATRNYVDLTALASSWPPVAARTTTNPNPGTGSAGLVQSACRVGRTVHRVETDGVSRVRVEYGNWYTQQNTPGEVAGPNVVNYRAVIEYPAGVWSPVSGSTAWSATTVYYAPSQVTYNGVTYVARQQTTAGHLPSSYVGVEWDVVTRYLVHWTGEDSNRRIACAAGSSVQSIPVQLATPLRSGKLIAVTTEATTASTTQYIPPGDLAYTSSPGWDFALDYTSPLTVGAAGDPLDSGVTTQSTLGNGTAIPMPLAITGLAASNGATMLLGDSILLGIGDNYVDSYQPGWAVRAIPGTVPWWRAAKTGDEAGDFLSGGTLRLAIAARCSRVICDYGTNEVRDGNSLATIQANLVSVWAQAAQRGCKVWHTTITPQTTSTDSWASTANQTAASGFGASSVWANLNSWLRGGASYYFDGTSLVAGQTGHPLTGVLDVAAAVTDATTTWAWKASYTSDGIHPNATGHAAIATALANAVSLLPVDLSSAQTIGGVKTFTSSPIVPTPTTSGQAATKGYADTGDALAVPLTQRAAANGVATLDSGIKIPIAQVPTGTTGTTVALGNHNHALSTLTGVALSSPATGDVLNYDGTNWANSARVSTLESLLSSVPTDTQHYGDQVSSCRRPATTNSSALSNGYWTTALLLSPKTFTATKLRFYISGAGVAGGSPTVSVSLYGGAAFPLSLLATVPVTASTFTSTGIKELTLSASVNVVAGNHYAWISYIAPSSYTTSPAVGCTAVYFSALNNPSASSTYAAYKAASTTPGSTINPSDGTWTADVATLWWALL
jgi:hypothetical protein